jgi:hypothetical protein
MIGFRELTDKNIRGGSFPSVPDPIRSEANVGSESSATTPKCSLTRTVCPEGDIGAALRGALSVCPYRNFAFQQG